MSTTALMSSAPAKAVSSTPNSKSGLPSSISLPNLNFTTPTKDGKQAAAPSTITPQKLGAPGRWQHPRLDEVIRRRNATNFDGSNVKAIGFNLALIVGTLSLPKLLRQFLPTSLLVTLNPYSTYLLYALHALFIANIAFALLPLLRTPDACEDVPLTPSQRRLLGLPPMSRPATPAEQEQYVTPPRFARASPVVSGGSGGVAGTPRSVSGSLFAEISGSPSASSVGSSSARRAGSPFYGTPDTKFRGAGYNPMRAGGVGAGIGENAHRRLSFHSTRSSPLSISDFDAAGSITTPTKGARASVGLNNKWLYEKGRGSPLPSPRGGSLFS